MWKCSYVGRTFAVFKATHRMVAASKWDKVGVVAKTGAFLLFSPAPSRPLSAWKKSLPSPSRWKCSGSSCPLCA